MKDVTDINIVLDRSGSMALIANDVIGGFNAFIEEQKLQSSEAILTLIQFDHDYEVVHDGIDINRVPLMTNRTFIPRGMTALLDAIGRTIVSTGSRLDDMNAADRPNKVVFVIITDGHENKSTEYSKPQIDNMIKTQTDGYQWEFIFLGANQDAITTGRQMGFDAGNSLSVGPSGQSMGNAIRSASTQVSTYRSTNQVTGFSDEDRKDALDGN